MPERPQSPELSPPDDASADTLSALRRLFVIAVVCAAGLSVTYAVPSLEKFRPYVSGEDPVPFGEWFGMEGGDGFRPPNLAGYQVQRRGQGGAEAAAESAGVSSELMAEAQEAAAEGDDGDDGLEPPPMEIEAVDSDGSDSSDGDLADGGDTGSDDGSDASDGGTTDGQDGSDDTDGSEEATAGNSTASDGSDGTPPVRPNPVKPNPVKPSSVTISPSEYEGITRELEDPSGKAMERFYESLLRTAERKKGAITRISHWGASVIGADGMTSVARRKLQKRFGSAGKGWVNAAPGWKWYKQRDVEYSPDGWKSRTVTSNSLKGARYGAGRYGFGGVAGIGWGAKSKYRVYARKMELYYLEYPKGGKIEVIVDGGDPIEFSTRGEEEKDAYRVFEAEGRGEHTFEVRTRGGGNVHAYGVTLENPGPGVIYDCIGLIGTRASRILNYDEAHLKEQVSHRNPNLQIIMFGGNELVDKGMNMSIYEKKYTEVIRRLRAGAPNASCMMMTPVDHGERYRGRVRTVPMLKEMIPVQQRVAEKMGCAFFNTFEAMGGEGSVGRWYYAKPRLAWGDFAHLTRAGDRVLGAMVYKALMKGFADWLAKR